MTKVEQLLNEQRIKEFKAHLESEDLDELVHELKSKEAATINNGGVSSQVAWLVQEYGSEAALKWLEPLVTNKS